MVVRHAETAINRGRSRAPILVQFEADGSSFDLLRQTRGQGGVAFSCKTEVQREIVHRLQHHFEVERAGSTGGGTRADRRTSATADHRGQARRNSFVSQLRAYKMDVGIQAARRKDE